MRTNLAAITDTIHALRSDGHLGPGHGALVTLAESLAAAVDMDPGNASLWREYRAAVQSLMEVAADDDNDEAAEFLASVRAKMGNTPKP